MKVSEKDVAYVADLANLQLSVQEKASMVRDLNSILDYMDRLNALDTSNVAPMAQISAIAGAGQLNSQGSSSHSDREDIPQGLRKSLPQEGALANAPDSDGTFFRVPKVIER